MASPAQDLLDTGRRLRQGASAPLLPDEQAAVGTTAGVLRNMPTAMPSPYAPGVAPKPGASGQVVDLKPAAPQGVVGRTTSAVANAPRAGSNALMQGIRNPGVLAAGGTALAAAPEALRVGDVFVNPKATWNDVGTQAAEGVGRLGAAGAGAAGGAVLGSVLGPVGAGIGGVAGGLYGYWAGDKAIRSLRGAAGVDPRSPAEQLGAPAAQTRVQGFTGEKPTIATAPTAPTTSAAPSIREPFSDVRTGTYGGAAPNAPDLTGKIVKGTDANGNAMYSGSNIKGGADIVDSAGKILNTNDRTNPQSWKTTGVSVAGPGGAGRSPMDIYANTSRINGQISDTVRALDAYGPGGGGGINGDMFDSLRAKNPAVPATRAERMAQAELASRARIAEAQTGATLRGQDIVAGTSRANTRDTVGASLRGQDMDYAEKMDAKRLDLASRMADRKLRADIFEVSGGSLTKAAEIAAANGVDPASFISAGAASQTQGEKADAAGRGMFKNLFDTPGKDGKMEPRPDLEAQAYASVMQQTGNKFGALPKEQQTALMTESVARVRELESARSRQNGTFGQSWLGRPNEAALDSLPTTEQNAGSKLRHANPWDAFNSNVQMNDVLQTLPDGRVIARDPKLMTQSRLKQLEEQGARWEK